MKWPLHSKWTAGSLGLALCLLSAVSIISYQNARQLSASAQRIRQTHYILNSLTGISATLIDAESGRRGYILFNDPEELERYDRAVIGLTREIASLRRSLVNLPLQQQRLDALEVLVVERLNLFQQSIDRYKQAPAKFTTVDPLFIKINRNRDKIRNQIANLYAEEEKFLQAEVSQSQVDLEFRIILEFLGTFITFAVLLGVYTVLFKQMVKRQEAEVKQQKLVQEKELSQLKLQFFSMVSHEFRTPLSLVIGSAQLLESRLKSTLEPSLPKHLSRIQAAAQEMKQLLNDILMLSRADAGKLEFHPQTIELQMFCLNLIEDMQFSGQPKHPIQFTKQGNITYARLDEKLLYAILSNLLSNAFKYSPPESTVFFTLVIESGMTIFQIRDQGIGIPADELPTLYDPFSRGSQAKEKMGSGLGLAVVKKCVEIHGGEILVNSQVGVGTLFTVKLPH